MPSASTSTFIRPSASMSSLSHWITVRAGIAAFSTGTRRSSRPRLMTKPPTCCDRWRGKPISICAIASQRCTPASAGSSPTSAKRCGSSSRFSHQARLPARRVDRRQRKAQRAPGVAQRAAGAVADHGGGQRGALAAVSGVDVLDHFLAPLVLEVDVDVGRLVAFLRDEALEQHRGARRIDLGDVRARSTPPSWPPSRAPGRGCPARAPRRRCHAR
jgi:hypothetical protein